MRPQGGPGPAQGWTFLQINLGKGGLAQNLCFQAAVEHRADVLLLSEPSARVDTAEWYADASGRAAIVIANRSLRVGGVLETPFGFASFSCGGVNVFSCYFSPNDTRESFAEDLAELERRVQMAEGDVIIAGDFNAKSPMWGEWRRDWRGMLVEDLIARLDLAVVNVGDSPTFTRGVARSIIDLTLASQHVARRISGWQVLEEESLSDHSYIRFHLGGNDARLDPQAAGRRNSWNPRKIDPAKFDDALEEIKLLDVLGRRPPAAGVEERAEGVTKQLVQLCDRCMPRRRPTASNRSPKYWWSEEIAALRKECLKARRRATRSRGDPDLTAAYKMARNALKKAIKRSKEGKWRDLLEELEDDPWGLPYKIVCKRLGASKPIPRLREERWVREIVHDLFPSGNESVPVRPITLVLRDAERFSLDDLTKEGQRLQAGKSPGPDGIPNEILKRVIEAYPSKLLDLFNGCLEDGSFPKPWKRQKLILLRKGDKPLDRTSSYRPICLLDTMGKVLEGLVLARLEEFIASVGGFSPNQFGFRRGVSTVDAIRETLRTVKEARERGAERKGFCAMIAIDIRNAFNSLRWQDVLDALAKRNVPQYLRHIVEDYLHQRRLLFDGDGWTLDERVSRGAPQGSRLGPFFWKMVYDDLLGTPLPDGVKLIGFADDTIVVVEALAEHILEVRMAEGIAIVESWLASRGLEMAVQKTEAVLVTKRRSYRMPRLVIGGVAIDWRRCLTYLGVEVDRGLSFGQHVDRVSRKAAAVAGNLSRLMPNVGGPREGKRRLYASVIHSILLYAAPAWVDAMAKKTSRARLLSAQRQIALRVAAAYRTVSLSAVMVVAGIPPVDLLVYERTEVFEHSQAEGGVTPQLRREARRRLISRWQERWEQDESGRWTHRLIPSVDKWVSRGHGESSFHLTQVLTGHGCFRAYLHRFRRSESPACLDCGAVIDDADHAIFRCDRWIREREDLSTLLGIPFSPENMVDSMLSCPALWRAVEAFILQVIRRREAQLR